MFQISVITSVKPDKLTKTLRWQNGQIVTESGGHMVLGVVKVIMIACLLGLAEVIHGLHKNQALCYGIPKGSSDGFEAEIKAEKMLTEYDAAIARSNHYFEYHGSEPAVLMLDIDQKPGEKPLSMDEVVSIIRSAVPELQTVKMLWIPSASSQIFHAETGERLTGICGQRLYIIVNRASDIPQLGQIIVKRLWLAGHGYIKIGSRGQMLLRTLVDATVWQPSRLDFAAGANCISPLEQRERQHELIYGTQAVLNSLKPLTPEEETQFSFLVKQAKEETKPAADKRFEDFLQSESEKLPEVEREAYVSRQRKSRGSLYLFGDQKLIVINSDGCEQEITIQEILLNPEKYDKLRVLDPIDPDYGDRESVGILNLRGGKPNLYCFTRECCYTLVKLNKFGLPDAELVALADMSDAEYERNRVAAAKDLGVRVKFLDQAVKYFQGEMAIIPRPKEIFLPEWDVQPSSEAVKPIELADRIYATLCHYVVADGAYLAVATMWIMLTWLIERATVMPRIIISAPEKGCGKTVCLTTIGMLCQKPIQSASITPASLFRLINLYQPTLLIDEADTLPKENDQLRGLLNAGHTRDSAIVIRTEEVNGEYTPVVHKCFGAIALAGIKLEKKLPGTVLSRGILIQLRKKKRDEKTHSIRRANKKDSRRIQQQLARFGADFADKFEKMEPQLDELDNRDADNWEPLIAIAMLCGSEWEARIRLAATALTADSNSESIDIRLLRDIKAVFESKKASELTTAELIDGLSKIDTAPWRSFSKGGCISARHLADRLEPFGVRPIQLGRSRIYDKNPRGYRLDDFNDTFERYLGERKQGSCQSMVTEGPSHEISIPEGLKPSQVSPTEISDSGEKPVSTKSKPADKESPLPDIDRKTECDLDQIEI